MESIQLIGDFKWNCSCPAPESLPKAPHSDSEKQTIVAEPSHERTKFVWRYCRKQIEADLSTNDLFVPGVSTPLPAVQFRSLKGKLGLIL